MRILLVADIHANWPALQAIREEFDACLFLGDAVDYGVEGVPCIEWIREHATASVRGNHDHAVAHRVMPRVGRGLKSLAAATRQHHWETLSPRQIRFLARLPVTRTVALGGLRFAMVHATPRDPMDEHLLDDPDAWRARLEHIHADFLCVGHTHVPFQLDLGRIRVVNPGSVGQPRDGDPRCAYAIIEDGRVELKRVAYDIDATVAALRRAGLPDTLVDYAERVLRTGGKAEPPPDLDAEETSSFPLP